MTSHSLVLAVFGLGGGELMIILAIFLLLFGGAKLPGLARGLGQSIKEFKKAAKEEDPATPEAKPTEAKKVEPAGHGSN
jgi:sec-independent protein translocase protein TatA